MFQPGQSGNPNGRPAGSANKITSEVFRVFKERGYRHPAVYCAEVYEDQTQPIERRDQMAAVALPWFPKQKLLLHRFVEQTIQVPDFKTIEEAQDFQKEIASRAAAGELELQTSLDISALVGNWIRSRQVTIELDLKVQAQRSLAPEQLIRIEGGLPRTPRHERNHAAHQWGSWPGWRDP